MISPMIDVENSVTIKGKKMPDTFESSLGRPWTSTMGDAITAKSPSIHKCKSSVGMLEVPHKEWLSTQPQA